MSVGALALLDKLAATLDDIVIATKKASGVIGDDLAVASEGFVEASAKREIPMVLAVMKRSFINKIILVPLILALSYFLPFLITPILFLGGLYLSFEGAEKIYHYFKPHHDNDASEFEGMSWDEVEKIKVKEMGTIDMVLSLEICLIALNSVQNADLQTQAIVLSSVAIIATFFIYGVSALIIRSDDFGLYLMKNSPFVKFGKFLIGVMPKFIKGLSVVGTIAMLVVGGEILVHSIGHYWHPFENIVHIDTGVGFINILSTYLIACTISVVAGFKIIFLSKLIKK